MKNKSFLRLLGFEWKKNFLNPWILLFLVALLLVNSWKLSAEYRKKTAEFASYDSVYQNFYDQWSGTITVEHIWELMEIYGPLMEKEESMNIDFEEGSGVYTNSEYGDYEFFFSQFENEMEFDYLYINEAIGIVEDAKELAEFYRGIGNSYKTAESEAFARVFQYRVISQFADTRYIEVWLNHDYSSMLIVLLSLFGLCTVFVTERETEMYMLQRTSKLGSGMTVAAKLTASTMFILLICILFYCEDFLVLQILSGHSEALDSPIYAIRNLEATPLNMTVGQFVLWSGGIKILGMLGCAAFILLCSCLCRHVLTTFISGFGGIMILVILQEFCRTRVGLKWFNPIELIMAREIVTDTVFVNVFGIPIHLFEFVIIGVLLTTAVMVLAILRFNPGRMERRTGR